mgnify:CR=1 FL=1
MIIRYKDIVITSTDLSVSMGMLESKEAWTQVSVQLISNLLRVPCRRSSLWFTTLWINPEFRWSRLGKELLIMMIL